MITINNKQIKTPNVNSIVKSRMIARMITMYTTYIVLAKNTLSKSAKLYFNLIVLKLL